ncbi:DUF2752 domain-containing protein [Aeromicrobium sp.]|uniref:DUF2752 domain-containing protein n=1 Tax=Aeromicrobium sp. TaxID=1871063 RepID=UPI0019CDB415|nr:DUF2752 domain-containing protein [Aeromicrobium sp.]MBC7631005.1 DUF2752 domain-containing protein [Aeromicrobium sp.]
MSTTTEVGARSAASLRDPVLVGMVGLGAFTLLHLHDPHGSGSYGYCPFLVLTGKPCPGCGGLRAVNDLTRGDVVGAVSSNVLAVALVGVLAVAWVLWVARRMRGRRGRMIVLTPTTGVVVVIVMVLFGVLRNTPWGAWLAP